MDAIPGPGKALELANQLRAAQRGARNPLAKILTTTRSGQAAITINDLYGLLQEITFSGATEAGLITNMLTGAQRGVLPTDWERVRIGADSDVLQRVLEAAAGL